MAYYRRATVYLAMGKSKSALPDLSKVIELKPDFTSVSNSVWHLAKHHVDVHLVPALKVFGTPITIQSCLWEGIILNVTRLKGVSLIYSM